jgi:hypothetical protein
VPHVRHGERIGFCQDCAPCHEFACYNHDRECQRALDAKRLPICAIARHEACGWREWLVSISGYSSRARKADEAKRMCRLVEAAAVLPPAPAGRSRWRIISIASARHRRSPHKGWQKTHSLSAVVPPPDSSVARTTAAKAIWQQRKKHSMHEQYACVWLDVEC